MSLNSTFLDHPATQRLPKTEQEWIDFTRVLTSSTVSSEVVDTSIQEQVAVAQAAADNAQDSADAAQADADTAQAAATAAQADADTAQGTADTALARANDVWITATIQDIDADGSASADGRMNIVSPAAGTISAIYTVINSAVVNVTVITTSINGTPVTGGAVTIGALSVKGDVDSATPSAANTVAVGSAIEVSSDGAAGATCKANVLMKITRT